MCQFQKGPLANSKWATDIDIKGASTDVLQPVPKTLVWGFRSQAENSRHAIFSFNPISLFDLKAHFFAPTRIVRMLSRAGTVKVGRRSDISSRSGDARPYLDSPEYGSTLVVVGMTRSRGARLSRTNIRAATLYSVGRNDPDHDAVLRIGSESSEAAGPFCTTA